MTGVVVVGLPGAAQDRLSPDVPYARSGVPGAHHGLLPQFAAATVDSVELDGDLVTFRVRAKSGDAACSGCGRRSSRVHVGYQRQLADLPLGGRRVRVATMVSAAPQGGRFSYFAPPGGPEVAATAGYGTEFAAIVARRNIMATQFHCEKSGPAGLRLLETFTAPAREELP
jgi:hypothetical protein